VAKNATRLSNLPQETNYALVAFAPWFSPTCMLEYFQSARNSPVKAFLVYQPGTSAMMPPPMNDVSWGLGDGGQWKSANNFPTYALMSVSGGIIAEQLSLYSGNITDAPHAEELVSLFSPADYVRLWATVNTESQNQLPSLWVFLVIVLGILIVVIFATSTVMHVVQRRRRNDLRQRVINGEVNLEALGVKRLTVPREYLEKLPLYTYSGDSRDRELEKTLPQPPSREENIPSPVAEAGVSSKTNPLGRRSSAPDVQAQTSSSAFSQPTCPICLDDFESNESQVRELPCRHIFHPDCVDTFLLSNSSLCPMCKTSVLPSGYCPALITNVMVRRERMIRRTGTRATENRAATEAETSVEPPAQPPRAFGSIGSRVRGAVTGRRVFSAPERMQPQPTDIEMGTPGTGTSTLPAVPEASQSVPTAQSSAIPECTDSTSQNRREWARERAMTLLGNRQNIPVEGEDEEHGPRWKRGLRRVFPGFR
jgi:hypothetical protein